MLYTRLHGQVRTLKSSRSKRACGKEGCGCRGLCTHLPCCRAALWQRPGLGADNLLYGVSRKRSGFLVGSGCGAYLAFAVRPEVRHHADDVVEPAVGALVDEQRAQSAQRVHDQARLDAAVQPRAREEGERPLPREADDAEDEVYDLEDGEGLNGRVQVLGQEVPEDLGPEEGLEGGCYLVCGFVSSCSDGWMCGIWALTGSSCQDDQPRPVVLD